MAISSDSYGSVDEVAVICRQYLEGNTTFNFETAVTITQVERFIDRASGALNLAIMSVGITTPVTNSVVVKACADWVTLKVSQYVALTYSNMLNADGNPLAILLDTLMDDAKKFVDTFIVGIADAEDDPSSMYAGGSLVFTGQNAVSSRSDPTDTSLAQPSFKRNQFDNPGVEE